MKVEVEFKLNSHHLHGILSTREMHGYFHKYHKSFTIRQVVLIKTNFLQFLSWKTVKNGLSYACFNFEVGTCTADVTEHHGYL